MQWLSRYIDSLTNIYKRLRMHSSGDPLRRVSCFTRPFCTFHTGEGGWLIAKFAGKTNMMKQDYKRKTMSLPRVFVHILNTSAHPSIPVSFLSTNSQPLFTFPVSWFCSHPLYSVRSFPIHRRSEPLVVYFPLYIKRLERVQFSARNGFITSMFGRENTILVNEIPCG